MALFTFHANIGVFHLQPIRIHEVSTQHMAIRKVFHLLRRKSHQLTKDFKQATSINGKHSNSCPIVCFNIVDHTARLELSDKSNYNLTSEGVSTFTDHHSSSISHMFEV